MHTLYDRLDRISAWVARVAAQFAVVVLACTTLLILTEIVLRSFFATSTNITEEYVGYGLGTMVFLGLGHAVRTGSLVRVDIVLGRLGPGARRVMEVLTCLVAFTVMAFVVYYMSIRVGRDFSRGTISTTLAATPIWIPNAVVLTGMLVFLLQVFFYSLGLLIGRPLIKEAESIE